MKRSQLEKIALSFGIEQLAINSLSYEQLREAIEAAAFKVAEKVPAGIDIADWNQPEKDNAYEQAIADALVAEGIPFTAGDAGNVLQAAVEIPEVVTPINTPSGALEAHAFIRNGNKFFLAPHRNEKTRQAVVRFVKFSALEKVAATATVAAYTKLLVTAIVYDAAGNGLQGNYTMNSALIDKLKLDGVFKGVPSNSDGVPQLDDVHNIYAMVEFSTNEKGVTTWGDSDALIVKQAKDQNKCVYSVKGREYAAVYHREDSKQESLDRVIGVVDEVTIKRLKEKELTSLELDGARKAQDLQIQLDFKEKSLQSEKKTMNLKHEVVQGYVALGYSLQDAILLSKG